jgi:hypothetical protein
LRLVLKACDELEAQISGLVGPQQEPADVSS